MKNLLTIVLISLSTASFSQVENNYTFKTECTSINENGTVLMNIWDTKKGDKYKESQASSNAVQSLLYSGFGGGKCGYLPALLLHKEEIIAFEELNLYFFKKSGDFADYVISIKLSKAIPSKMKNKDSKVYEITVDLKKLDQYLVDEKIKNKTDNNY